MERMDSKEDMKGTHWEVGSMAVFFGPFDHSIPPPGRTEESGRNGLRGRTERDSLAVTIFGPFNRSVPPCREHFTLGPHLAKRKEQTKGTAVEYRRNKRKERRKERKEDLHDLTVLRERWRSRNGGVVGVRKAREKASRSPLSRPIDLASTRRR